MRKVLRVVTCKVSIEYWQLSDKTGIDCNAIELVFVSAIFVCCSYCFSLKLVSIFDVSLISAADQLQ